MAKTTNKMQSIEQIDVEKLIPYARNARIHNEKQVAQIAASIREFGFNNPVLIDESNNIIAGHGRVLAARALEMSYVPCLRLAHLSDVQKRAYILADNKLALNATWDVDMLKLEFEDISKEIDATLSGFSQKEITNFFEADDADGESQLNSDLQYKVIVDCNDEMQQTELLSRFEEEGLTCRPLIS